jgi:hypothetical protein
MRRYSGESLVSTAYASQSFVLLFFSTFFQIGVIIARLFMHTFLRRGFGERYYRLIPMIFVVSALGFWPSITRTLEPLWAYVTMTSPEDAIKREERRIREQAAQMQQESEDVSSAPDMQTAAPETAIGEREDEMPPTEDEYWARYHTWYLMLLALVIVACVHLYSIRMRAEPFDFTRISTYEGDYGLLLVLIRRRINLPDQVVERFIEPGIFIVLGLLLQLLDQPLGTMFITLALFYSASYYYEEQIERWNMMNRIDKIFVRYLERGGREYIHDGLRSENVPVHLHDMSDDDILHKIAPELPRDEGRFVIR